MDPMGSGGSDARAESSRGSSKNATAPSGVETKQKKTLVQETLRRKPCLTHSIIRNTKDAVRKNQYVTAYRMLARRRKVAFFNAKAENTKRVN